ncbi:MAG: cyclase family protein [Clostridiales bacterium]|nr:cyclase family protein [Clostridiales bacterium]
MNWNSFQIFDISMKISHDMPVYKGKEEKRPKIIVERDFTSGSAYESRLEMNMHTGTHLDRSLHMLPGGTKIDSLKLEQVITKCKVLDLTSCLDKITSQDLKDKDISEGDFIILKTRNSFDDILEGDFIYLDDSGAVFLRDKKIKGVGIDSLGIERSQPEHPTHIKLLESDIVILEGLRLKDIEEGEYLLVAAPINVPEAEAAPVRAVLLR